MVKTCAAVLLLWSVAALAGDGSSHSRISLFEVGEDVFFHETFGGNGRTCATCHDPRNEFTVSPELVRQRFSLDPSHPLFRAIDSDDGLGHVYTTLLDHALFRVTIPLHPNVTLLDARAQRTITVLRGVPSIANVRLTAPYLADGRAATLQEQAEGGDRGAHAADAQADRQGAGCAPGVSGRVLLPAQAPRANGHVGSAPQAPGSTFPVTSPAALRGKASFDLHCARCHAGELADRPDDPEESHFANAFVSDANTLNLPIIRLAFKQQDGSFIETVSPDPGRAALTGDIRDLNVFDTPSLRGLKHTAPYFHDNSAATLDDVITHYNDHFQFQIRPPERDDLITFLESL